MRNLKASTLFLTIAFYKEYAQSFPRNIANAFWTCFMAKENEDACRIFRLATWVRRYSEVANRVLPSEATRS